MQCFVYILYSERINFFYKGQTSDLNTRLYRHNAGLEKATKSGVSWRLIWFTEKATRSEALKLEAKLKNLSRVRLVQFMLKYHKGVPAGADLQSVPPQ